VTGRPTRIDRSTLVEETGNGLVDVLELRKACDHMAEGYKLTLVLQMHCEVRSNSQRPLSAIRSVHTLSPILGICFSSGVALQDSWCSCRGERILEVAFLSRQLVEVSYRRNMSPIDCAVFRRTYRETAVLRGRVGEICLCLSQVRVE
jgi:hypothetical protein